MRSLDAVISSTLSDVVDLEGDTFVAIKMPSTWTAANLTFQACDTPGGTFADVYDDAGAEVTVVAAASRVIVVDFLARCLAPLRYIKVRSGTTGTPVTQAASRTLTLLVK